VADDASMVGAIDDVLLPILAVGALAKLRHRQCLETHMNTLVGAGLGQVGAPTNRDARPRDLMGN
jgi:hypothetical protein